MCSEASEMTPQVKALDSPGLSPQDPPDRKRTNKLSSDPDIHEMAYMHTHVHAHIKEINRGILSHSSATALPEGSYHPQQR